MKANGMLAWRGIPREVNDTVLIQHTSVVIDKLQRPGLQIKPRSGHPPHLNLKFEKLWTS